jgi:hypothetical protein
MRFLRAIGEDEMIAVFLRSEIDSSRYGDKLRSILARDGRGESLLLAPDLDDSAANDYRRRLLDEHRAYERREGLFLDFPRRVEWHRVALERDEVLGVLYIDWEWWLELSGGTRRPTDAARRILAGEIPGADPATDEALVAALRASPPPPELIAATTPEHAPIVLVEGHVRLTAYATFPHYLPDELEIVLGVSDEMERWCQF